MYKFISLLALIIASTLHASDPVEAAASASLASTEGLLKSVVAGHVSVISGEFVDHEVDLVIPGPSPLVLERSYHSSDTFVGGHLHQSWQLAEPTQLISSQKLGSKIVYAVLTTPHGARAKFHQIMQNNAKGSYEFGLSAMKGFTNCGGGTISGKTNLKNNTLFINNNDKKHSYSAALTSGDQTSRFYAFHYVDKEACIRFDPIQETKLNGTKKTIGYHLNSRVHIIDSTNLGNNLPYGRLTFTPANSHESAPITVTTNNGRHAVFHFLTHKYKTKHGKDKAYYLERVESSDKPSINYCYAKATGTKHHLLLTGKYLPNGRRLEVVYYQEGDNPLLGGNLHLKKDSLIIDRVKELRAPAGKDGELHTTHRFIYNYHLKRQKDPV
jgi:hypothetical protein